MRRRIALASPPALVAAACAALAGPPTAPPAALGAFPGANGRIVFDRQGPLFSVEPDGSDARQLTAPGISADKPAVSPDGRLIAFDRQGGPGYGIWTVNAADGSGARQVTVEPQAVAENDTDPAWSPDGSRIAFVRGNDLYVMNADGSGTANLTSSFASPVQDPDWAPTGGEIAFGASSQIFVVGAGGTPVPSQLNPTAPGNRSNPSWSPDASRIAYTRGPPGATGGIWTIDRATAPNETALLTGTAVGEVWELAWSPDGSKIGFISDVGNPAQEELFTVNADGSGLIRLNQDADTAMDWGTPSAAPIGLPPPVLGATVNASRVRGTVLIAVRAAGGGARVAQKGVRFVPLTESRQIPVGSLLDTRKGTVRVTSARDSSAKTQSGRFSAGIFQVLQSRKAKAKGLTELRLKGSSFKRCAPTRRGRARGSAGRTIRRLRGSANGRFRTRGRNSSATVRGTVWTVTDRCDGTLTTVKRGRVAVRDFRARKTIVVRAGKSYLAPGRP